jgi:hypothetical protein
MTTDQLTCEQRVDSELEGTLVDILKLWNMKYDNPDAEDYELGTLANYGLGFDYVAPHTFEDQDTGYFRWLLSSGGPSDEFRFYASPTPHGWVVNQIEYWFLNWFDGAHRELHAKDKTLLVNIFNDFNSMGTTQYEYELAMKDYEPDPTDFTDEDAYNGN